MSSQPEILLTSRIFEVVRLRHADREGREHIRDIVMHRGAVAIVPVLDDGRVVLIENYRISVGQSLIEIPAGTLEQGEPAERCALRELAEETGYAAATIRHLTTFHTSPGILREAMYLYLATDLTPGTMQTEPGEEIRVRITPLDDALAMIWNGQIQDAKTIVGLLWYAMEKSK